MIKSFVIAFVGFAGGLSVGAAFVSFLAVVGLIPRLAQLTKSYHKIRSYEWAIILGALVGTMCGLRSMEFHLLPILLVPIGLGLGVFVGMVAAGLTEVLNVLPILAKRLGVNEQILILLMAIVLGKMLGSLFHWSYFVNH
ncbi:stage V sporulation protein AB [Pullulanibacillus sp. KACC 23026]|uniref:stage V sporulation protein AB n=1 Tax=Pullulanibacillus sp. KACC 23026 TaxID=3028315 RepID=UPI0023AFBF0B|nr:stage V sporulation protein AB [Pullulanibacillus sp. KACC 23026]WEG11443.1 stage V sporulation protein AB [Pullulanibacillus sp. KACC 23026]